MITPLKWAGGKRWLVDRIQKEYKKSGCELFTEPFFGGGSVSLSVQPANAIVSDINFPLYYFWKEVKAGLVIDSIDCSNNEETFYNNRKLLNNNLKLATPNEKLVASLFYYLNRTCFNGLCRFNNKGEFNAPYGKYKTINFVYDFKEYTDKLKNIEIQNKSYKDLAFDKEAFVYLDPPYDTPFSKYSKEGFGWEEQVKLVDWVMQLDNKFVYISNQATDRIVKLYKDAGLQYEILEAPRRIASNGDRKNALEIFAWKP